MSIKPREPDRAITNDSPWAIGPQGWVAIIFLLIGATFLTFDSASTQRAAAAAALGVITLAGITLHALRRSADADWFSPATILVAFFLLNYGVRPLWVLASDDASLPLAVRGMAYERFFAEAVLLGGAALLVFLLGYFMVGALGILARESRVPYWPEQAPALRIYVIFGIGVVATLGRLAVGQTGTQDSVDEIDGSTFLLLSASQFVPYAVGIAATYVFRDQAPRHLRLALWTVFLPSCVIQSMLVAAKTPAFLALFAVAAAWNYVKHRLTIGKEAVAMAIVVALFLPFLNLYRSDVVSQLDRPVESIASFIDNTAYAVDAANRLGVREYLERALDGLLARSTGADTLAVLLDAYPREHPYEGGGDYLRIPLFAFVPRFVWPSKPTANAGTEFGRQFLVDPSEAERSTTSFGMTHVGDLYRRFGVIGVLVGCFALGWLFAWTYRMTAPLSGDPARVFIYTFVIWMMINGFEGDIPSVYGNLLKSLIVLLAVRAFLRTADLRHRRVSRDNLNEGLWGRRHHP